MKRENLKDLLEHLPEAKGQSGETWSLGGALEVTVFMEGGEMATVPRLERVELRPDYVVLVGAKGEMLFFPYEKIAGIRTEPRVAPVSGGTSKSPPGFGAR